MDAVLRETGGDYIRIVAANDLGALRYRMNEVERDEPEECEKPSVEIQTGPLPTIQYCKNSILNSIFTTAPASRLPWSSRRSRSAR